MTLRYLVPGLPQPLRLALFALVEAAGMFVQLSLSAATLPGTLIMIAGLFLVFARGYRNKPADLGFEDWQPVTTAELDRVRDNLERTRSLKVPFAWRRGFPVLAIVALAVLAACFAALGLRPLLVFDAFILLVPFLFSGRLRLWTPAQLKMKLAAFQPVVEQVSGGGLVLTPYLRLDKDREGRRIPEDIRLMVEPRRKPADFLGAQIQVAVNKGPNGAVPYMYAVFLCRGQGASFARLKGGERPGYVKETGQDDGFAYVVLRQETSGRGYHTTPENCGRLMGLVLEEMRAL